MKRLMNILFWAAVASFLLLIVRTSHNAELKRQTEIQSNQHYLGFLPIAQEPKLNMKIRQWEITFSINGNIKQKESWRTAFYAANQVGSSAPGLIEDQIYRLRVGDEVEVQEVLAGVMPQVGVHYTYFALSARSKL